MDKLLEKRPQEVKNVIYIGLIILGIELIHYISLQTRFHYYDLSAFGITSGFFVFLMWGVWNGRNWIRWVWIVLSIMGIPTVLIILLNRQIPIGTTIIYSIQFALSLTILYYLLNKKTTSWFKKIKMASSVQTVKKDDQSKKLKFRNQEEYENWKTKRLKIASERQESRQKTESDSIILSKTTWKGPYL